MTLKTVLNMETCLKKFAIMNILEIAMLWPLDKKHYNIDCILNKNVCLDKVSYKCQKH